MNNEKVYIEGYVVGFMADTMGTREKQIQVSSGEIVSIDEGFIHKSIAPEKVKVPPFVADWIEACKENLAIGLYIAMNPDFMKQWNKSDKLISWIRKINNQDLFARAWLDGYEVGREKRYLVKIKNMSKKMDCLAFKFGHIWVFRSSEENEEYRTRHTRRELEDADFGWVFDCPGIQIEEVN